MGSSLTQTTVDHRVSNRTIATVDLTALVEARYHSDPEVKDQATELINRAYSVQAEVDALTAKLNTETLTDLEVKHVDALIEKERLEGELKTLNLEGYSFQAENGRIQGRIQTAQNRLSDHRLVKQKWHMALISPKQSQEWQFKHDQLVSTLDAAKAEMITLQQAVNAFQCDQAVLANKIRVATAQAIYLYNRIQRMKGSKEPIFEAGNSGLAS